MNVERHLLGVGAPVLVAEAVRVFAVAMGSEGMVARGDASLIDFVAAGGIQNLQTVAVRLVLSNSWQ